MTKKPPTKHTPPNSDPLGIAAAIAAATQGSGNTAASLYGLTPGLAGTLVPDLSSPRMSLGNDMGSTSRSILQRVEDLYQMDDHEIAALQARLYSAGYYDAGYYSKNGKSKLQSKFVDDDTRKAFVSALIDAARSNSTVEDLLTKGAGAGLAAEGAGELQDRKSVV